MKLGQRMNAVMAAKLPARVKAILWVLARRANDSTMECWTSMERLAADSGSSISVCQRAIRALEQKGIVRSIRHPRRVTHFIVVLRVVKSTAQGGRIDRLNPSLNLKRKTPRPQEACVVCRKRTAVLDRKCSHCINRHAQQTQARTTK